MNLRNAVIGACESTGWGITRELDEAVGAANIQ
jgi:hypothetical protein